MNQEVDVTIKLVGTDKFQRDVKGAMGSVTTSANKTSGSLGSLGGIARSAFGIMSRAAIAAATAATAAFTAITVSGIKAAGELETAKQGFVTLLGSAEKADEVLNQIKKDAAKTPFELVGLIKANQLLTAVTKDGARSEKILMDVGKALAAMGKGQEELDRIIINLQQVGAVGKASMLDIKQFAFAGIPIFDMLKQRFENVDEAISDGLVTFEVLEELFAKAGAGSGQFAKAFENQAGTFQQRVANMKDAWTIFTADFVTKTGIFDIAKRAIEGMTSFMSTYGTPTIEFMKIAFRELGKGFMEILPAIADTWENSLKPALQELFGALGGIIGYNPKVETTAQVMKEAFRSIGFAIGAVIIVMAKLIELGVRFYGFFAKRFAEITKRGNEARQAFVQLGSSISNLVNSPAVKRLLEIWNILSGGFIGKAVTSIKTGDGKAQGGIVGGSSYSGDRILTPINSGEMVINRSQQSALFNFIKNMSNQPRVNINSLNMSSGMASPMQQRNDLVNLLGMI